MNRRFLIGLVPLIAAAVLIGLYQFLPKPDTRPVVTVKGYLGSEKSGLMGDPDIKQILHDRYRLTVDFQPVGSIEQVQGDTTGLDFLWPSSEVALQLYKDLHGGKANSTTLFNSPLVFYSWDVVTGALIQQNIVSQENGSYYVDDMPGLAKLLISDTNRKTWAQLGLPQLYGKFTVIPTDPTKSNSGFMFFGLLANMLDNGQVADETSLAQALPSLKTYYNGLGFLETSSGFLFDQFIRTGVGDKPIIVGYENLLVEFAIQNPTSRDQILKSLRIIYPRPTVWSGHPLIALTSKGEDLEKALQDPDIQKIAWEKHGFRSGLIGIQNDPKVLNIVGIPATITSVMPMPQPQVMLKLIQYLSQ